jgi:RNA polymerase sigma factor (sigma-70 family)
VAVFVLYSLYHALKNEFVTKPCYSKQAGRPMDSEVKENVISDKQAVQTFYEKYARKLFAYTRKNYSIGEDDAWTVVYKTIYKMAAVKHKYNFENPDKENAFVFKTHINYLRNYFRDNKSFEGKNFEIELDDKHGFTKEEPPPVESVQLKILQQELDKLEDWQRILLLMRGQDMPYSEISAFVNKPENQLKVYYARLKKQLLENVQNELTKLNTSNHEK